MKLEYTKGACSLATRIIINELGLPCEFEAVDLANKQTQNGKNFYTINPKGAVPTLVLSNGDVLTENAVIMQYLADTSHAVQLLPPFGDFMRYRVLEWLNYVATELHKGFSPLFNPNLPQEVKDQIIIPMLKMKMTFLDKHLEHNQYLLGNSFTLPDAYLFVMLCWATHFKLNNGEWKHLSRYFTELQKRKSIQQSLKEEGLNTATA
jgi:glutathione S-transferase